MGNSKVEKLVAQTFEQLELFVSISCDGGEAARAQALYIQPLVLMNPTDSRIAVFHSNFHILLVWLI